MRKVRVIVDRIITEEYEIEVEHSTSKRDVERDYLAFIDNQQGIGVGGSTALIGVEVLS